MFQLTFLVKLSLSSQQLKCKFPVFLLKMLNILFYRFPSNVFSSFSSQRDELRQKYVPPARLKASSVLQLQQAGTKACLSVCKHGGVVALEAALDQLLGAGGIDGVLLGVHVEHKVVREGLVLPQDDLRLSRHHVRTDVASLDLLPGQLRTDPVDKDTNGLKWDCFIRADCLGWEYENGLYFYRDLSSLGMQLLTSQEQTASKI